MRGSRPRCPPRAARRVCQRARPARQAAVAKKELSIQALREQLASKEQRIKHMEALFEQQRRDLAL